MRTGACKLSTIRAQRERLVTFGAMQMNFSFPLSLQVAASPESWEELHMSCWGDMTVGPDYFDFTSSIKKIMFDLCGCTLESGA